MSNMVRIIFLFTVIFPTVACSSDFSPTLDSSDDVSKKKEREQEERIKRFQERMWGVGKKIQDFQPDTPKPVISKLKGEDFYFESQVH